MTLLVRDTGGDPRLLVKLNAMYEREPSMQEHVGISPAMRDYVLRAFSESKLLIYEKYLTPEEIRHLRAHYDDRAASGRNSWPTRATPSTLATRRALPPAWPWPAAG